MIEPCNHYELRRDDADDGSVSWFCVKPDCDFVLIPTTAKDFQHVDSNASGGRDGDDRGRRHDHSAGGQGQPGAGGDQCAQGGRSSSGGDLRADQAGEAGRPGTAGGGGVVGDQRVSKTESFPLGILHKGVRFHIANERDALRLLFTMVRDNVCSVEQAMSCMKEMPSVETIARGKCDGTHPVLIESKEQPGADVYVCARCDATVDLIEYRVSRSPEEPKLERLYNLGKLIVDTARGAPPEKATDGDPCPELCEHDDSSHCTEECYEKGRQVRAWRKRQVDGEGKKV